MKSWMDYIQIESVISSIIDFQCKLKYIWTVGELTRTNQTNDKKMFP